ncbi:MAG: 7-carboxy-7-deazaguanine synthase QueE [Candidatus Zipacnadales bacterium]
MLTAHVAQIFSSVQGEGLYVGIRQLFIRTYGCNLNCIYCDTPASRTQTGPCHIERGPGSGQWEMVENPISIDFISGYISMMTPPAIRHHSIALTGGEPLLQPDFVVEVARLAHTYGLRAYLETNGQQVEALEKVIEEIDIVAMDVKLPRSQPAGEVVDAQTFLARSEAFLQRARRKEVFAKLVVTADVEESEVMEVAKAIANQSPACPLVLQPVTWTSEGAKGGVGPSHLLALQAAASSVLQDVRIIPQCHRLMGIL